VLIVGPVPPAEGGRTTGGVATHVSELAQALETLGWNVAVFADNTSPADAPVRAMWGDRYAPAPLRLRTLMSAGALRCTARVIAARTSLTGAGQNLRSVLSAVLGARRAARAHRPHVVHYHHAELRPLFGRLAGVNVPAVITAHSLSSFRDPEATALQGLARESLAAADAVLCVSADAARVLAEAVPGLEPEVVSNGIDLRAFTRPPETPPWSGPGPLVLYVGRIEHDKGVPDLVHAMVDIRARHPGATLALVGPQIDVDAAETAGQVGLSPEALVATGPVDPGDVPAWLHAADVLVLPSRVREGQPRVLIEAMAARTPIVAADVGGVRDLLGDGRYGRLVGAGDSSALAAAILSTLEHPIETAARVEAASSAVIAYDTVTVARQVAAVYDRVLADRSAS